MEQAKLRCERLTKAFSTSSGDLTVLRDVTATFEQGKTYAITGASGTGKSTLLHLLAGLESPTAGAIYYNKHNIALFADKQRDKLLHSSLGLMFQMPYLIKELTVLENVMLKGLIEGADVKQCKKQALALLKTVGLEDKASEKPATLSGGQQQRVALMRALFGKPAFLLADEPTGNLDPKTGQVIIDLLLQCQREWGMGIIVSTHDQSVAQHMQQQFELRDGQLHPLV